MAKQRNTALEWLRIVSMYMIVMMHCMGGNGVREAMTPGTAGYFFETFLFGAIQVCVNCFVMLSGYFMVKSQFRWSKLVSLWVQIVFYGFGLKLLMMVLGVSPISVTSLLSCFAPILTGRYWFITIYFGLYLLTPYLNLLVEAMNRRQHLRLTVLLFVLMSCMVSVHPSFKGMNSGGAWGLAWFVTMYLLGAYLRLYYRPMGGYCAWLFLLGYALCASVLLLLNIGTDGMGIGVLQDVVENWYRYDSAPVYVATVLLFCACLEFEAKRNEKKGNPGCPKWLASISGATLAVYLIHHHADVGTSEFWTTVSVPAWFRQPWYPLYQLALVAVIFAVCIVIDLLRQRCFRVLKVEDRVAGFLMLWSARLRNLFRK